MLFDQFFRFITFNSLKIFLLSQSLLLFFNVHLAHIFPVVDKKKTNATH